MRGAHFDAQRRAFELKGFAKTSFQKAFVGVGDVFHREVPRTLTGKKQELPVKKILLGRTLTDVVNKDACANPGAFDWYVDFALARQRRLAASA